MIMLKLALIVIFWLIAQPALGQEKFTKYLLIGLNGSDSITTYIALDKGATEVNPVLGKSYPRIIVTKVGLTMFVLWTSDYLSKHGHPKLGRFILASNSTAMAFATGHNLKTIRDLK